MCNVEGPRDAIRQYVLEHFPAAKSRAISDDDSLLASGIIDSLGVLELVQFMESEFGIMLSDDVMLSENFETIASIATLVSAQPDAACVAQQGI